jgi:hypothetical protein
MVQILYFLLLHLTAGEAEVAKMVLLQMVLALAVLEVAGDMMVPLGQVIHQQQTPLKEAMAVRLQQQEIEDVAAEAALLR